MFENIKQLEDQVQEFQENILASSKLLKDIEELTKTVNNSSDDINKELKETINLMEVHLNSLKENCSQLILNMSKNLDGCVENLKNQNEKFVLKLSEENQQLKESQNVLISEFKSMAEDYENNLTKLINENKTNYDKLIKKSIKEINTLNDTYRNLVEENTNTSKQLSNQLDSKYDAFISKFENLNIENITVILNDIKKDNNAKFKVIICLNIVLVIMLGVSMFVK